jgi:hypothetical protein
MIFKAEQIERCYLRRRVERREPEKQSIRTYELADEGDRMRGALRVDRGSEIYTVESKRLGFRMGAVRSHKRIIYVLAFAGFLAVGQRAKNGDRSVQPGEEIGDRDTDLFYGTRRARWLPR